MHLHELEDIVINITEEMNLRLDAPVPFDVFECWMFEEEARVPTTHLTVTEEVMVLDIVLFQLVEGIGKNLAIYPFRNVPMFSRNNLVARLGFRQCRSALLKVVGKGFVVEEDPRIVELAIEGALMIFNAR